MRGGGYDGEFSETSQGGVILRLDNDHSKQMDEMCYKIHKTLVNPIIDWSTEEVWEFLKTYNVPYCCLYDEGFDRLGCIGCPMGGQKRMTKEFARYPKYKALYCRAFEKMLGNRHKKELDTEYGKQNWKTAEDVMKWWMQL